MTLVIAGTFLIRPVHALRDADERAPIKDAWLTPKTKIALFSDARVRGREITVESTQGVVIIRGIADSDEVKQAVVDIAKGIGGVKE